MGVHVARGTAFEQVMPGVIPFVPNTTQPFQLQTNGVIEQVDFKLTGTLVLASYSAAPTLRVDGLENLVRGVRFTGNSKVTGAAAVSFSNADARSLRIKTAICNGAWPDRVNVGTANGTYNFETNFTKFFRAKRIRIKGGNDVTDLDTRKLQSLVVNIDWRDATALVTGGTGGTATLSNVQIVVTVKQRFVNGVQATAPYVKETLREIPLAAIGSGINKDIKNIPLSNILMRQYFMVGNSDVDYGDLANGIVATTQKPEGAHIQTIVTGMKGSVPRFDSSWAQVQTDNRHRFALPTWPAGVAVLEYAQSGLFKDLLDLRTTAPTSTLDAKNVLDLTLPGSLISTLWIMDEEFVPNL